MKPNREAAEKVAWLVYSHPELDNPGDIAVAMTIASFTNEKGEAWPSNETVGKHAHRGHTFVSESIARLKAGGILDWLDRTAEGNSNLYTIPGLVDDCDQTPSGKRIGSKTRSNQHVPTETAERRVRRENHERYENRHQVRKAKERNEAVSPAELEQFRAELLQQARASGKLEG
jgi:hypothetical protein